MAVTKRDNDQIDVVMNDILASLDIIKTQLPNGELKAIQERIERIDISQEDMKLDLRAIKRQLLDPEDGVIVRVNKNTCFRKKTETEESTYDTYIIEHKSMMIFKNSIIKAMWIIFTAIAGIIAALIFGNTFTN